MSGNMTFDPRGTFRAGLRHKMNLTKKTEAEVLNGALGDVALTAIKYTPAAAKTAIKSDLTNNGLVFKLVQSRSFDRRLPRSLQGFGRAKRTRAEITAAGQKYLAIRLRSSNNIKAGFIRAGQAMGKKPRGKVSSKGNTGRGYGVKATPSKLVALGVNAANGALDVASPAVEKAMGDVGRRMLTYAPKQIAKAWK